MAVNKIQHKTYGDAVNAWQQSQNSNSQSGYMSPEEAREYNKEMMDYQHELNTNSAMKQMEFQKEMSNSAYQRAIEDLKKAGLNPTIALGGPASTPTGAMATTSGANASISSGNGNALLQTVLTSAMMVALKLLSKK